MVMTSRTVRKTFIKVPNDIDAGGPTSVKVGFPAGTPNVDKAIYNEFGTRGGRSGGGWGGPIPERPFMRNAMQNNRSRYTEAMKSSVASIMTGKTNLRAILAKLGALAAGDIQKEITALQSPPNSPVTIALKGSSNPLIDSGEMRGSVTWKID